GQGHGFEDVTFVMPNELTGLVVGGSAGDVTVTGGVLYGDSPAGLGIGLGFTVDGLDPQGRGQVPAGPRDLTAHSHTVVGPDLPADLDGTSGDDLIVGAAGNDSINGGGGDDAIHAGDGDDSAFGSIGNDTLFGNDGNDTLNGSDGDDVLLGDAGNDSL